jgi:hypothetical protein
MPSVPQLIFDFPQGGPKPVAPGLSPEHELTAPGAATDVRKTKKVERLGLSQTPLCPVRRREAAELDQAGFLRVHRQPKLLQSHLHGPLEPLGVTCFVKSDDNVVSVPNNYDVPLGMAFAPLVRPEVEDIVKIDICQQR